MRRVSKILGILLAAALFLGLLVRVVVFDEKNLLGDSLEGNFKKNVMTEMRLIVLDYMNELDIKKCQDLHLSLQRNVNNLEEIKAYGRAEDVCDMDALNDLFVGDAEGPYELYNLGHWGTLISAHSKNGFKVYKYFDESSCSFDYDTRYKNLAATENSMILRAKGKYYLISEWYSKYRYVFFYLDKAPQFNEVNCRFDVI
ncbi:MAG: hypothetical protein LBL47_04685 [Lactobacillus sp.]|jgi:hypothetical protein|nr:hypothetical protein [Lactobacillus sp.]